MKKSGIRVLHCAPKSMILYEQFKQRQNNRNTVESCDSRQNQAPIISSSLSKGAQIVLGGITWTVIAEDDLKALLLADSVVGNIPYNKKCKAVTWESCTLRKWLNDYYYEKLSDEEKSIIVEVENENPDNPDTRVQGGNNTVDRVFVLSFKELNDYLPEVSDRANGECWRTRTPGEEQRQTIVIGLDGLPLDSGEWWVEFDYGIRPAIWIGKQN